MKGVKKELSVIQEMIGKNTALIKAQFKVWYGRVQALANDNGDGDSESSKHQTGGNGRALQSADGAQYNGASRAVSARASRSESKLEPSEADAMFLAARAELLARKRGK